MYDPILYGKDNTERIVSCEPKDEYTELFIQQDDGSIVSKFVPNSYWILSHEPIRGWVQLNGDLYYKWAKRFDTREEFLKARMIYRKSNDLFSIFNPKESFLVKYGYTYYKGLKPEDLSILAFDIESTSLKEDETAQVLCIANTFRKNGKITRKLFSYSDYETEAELIDSWCNWVREINPSVLCGHNIYGYDLLYLDFIATRAGTKLLLGRDGSAIEFDSYESKFRKDGSQFYHYKKCRIYGREIVDTMFLAIKYDVGRKYDSYGLKAIIKHEGLEADGRVFYDASQIRFKYQDPEEWAKITAYAEFDGDDALALYDLMIPSFFYMSQMIPKSFEQILQTASGSQLNAMMIRGYLQNRHSIPKASGSVDFEGAISFGEPGIYKNVFKVDVASLYPSIILTDEVYDCDKDPDRNFLHIMQTLTERRLYHKKLAKESKYDDDMQSSFKILINSGYGFLGADGLNFNSPECAAYITERGREILTVAIDWAKNKDLTVINGDTDSISFCKWNQADINDQEQQSLLQELNSLYPSTIHFEDDGYFPKIIILKAKNYILFDGKKIKYKGSSLKSSTLEIALREFLETIVESMIYDRSDYLDIYHRYINEIYNIKDIKRWCSKKTITDKVLESERTNEAKVRDAIKDSEYVESDKIWVFYDEDDSLVLAENFKGRYNKSHLLKKLFKATERFETVLNPEMFLNYSLKRNLKKLEELSLQSA